MPEQEAYFTGAGEHGVWRPGLLYDEPGWKHNERTHMTSMEVFGAIAIDHFTGRRVEKVADGERDAVWTITFEGNAKVHNFDPTIPMPTQIVGAALTRTILETKRTRLQFGLEQIVLNPLEYAIEDPSYTHGELVYAQRSEANMPPDSPPHPDERIAEEPGDGA